MKAPAVPRSISFLPVLLSFLCACGTNYKALRMPKKDLYPDFAALAAANTEGRDYSREIYDRRAGVSVFAVHGGDIEAGTSRLARNIAGADFNLYIFNGWLGRGNRRLHVTSVNFDDPQAVALSSSAALAVSVHGQMDKGMWTCVGGSSAEAGRLVAGALVAAGFEAGFPCRHQPGVNARNIVNRAKKGGVQLELTPRLLRRLETSPADLSKFTDAVRGAVFEVLQKASGETQ